MFVKRDLRKIGEILADPEDERVEMHLARRKGEFGGSLQRLCQPQNVPAMANLLKLSLYDDGIASLDGIGMLSRTPLEELNLGRNALTLLPPELGQITTLKRIWAEDNRFETFPLALLRLGGLEELRLSGNAIETLPEQLGTALSALEILAVDNNRLRELPASLGLLSALTALVVRGNRLESLPAELCQLSNLQLLCASSNSLSSLPEGMAAMTELTNLLLNANNLTELPVADLRQLPNLQKLNVSNNKLKQIPAVELWESLTVTLVAHGNDEPEEEEAEELSSKRVRVVHPDDEAADAAVAEGVEGMEP